MEGLLLLTGALMPAVEGGAGIPLPLTTSAVGSDAVVEGRLFLTPSAPESAVLEGLTRIFLATSGTGNPELLAA